jgi:hypothetical protein
MFRNLQEDKMDHELDFAKVIRTCVECEREFVKLDKRQQYCSVECRRKSNNRISKLKKDRERLKGPDLFAA